MKALVTVLALAAVPLLAGCMSDPATERARAAEEGSLMRRTLRSYHVAHSDRSGSVGYMKVFDVREAGGPVFRWSYVYDRDFTEMGFVDQFGTAFQFVPYPPGAMPNPAEPYRIVKLPQDSLARNAARMLGLDPAAENLTFPLAQEGQVR